MNREYLSHDYFTDIISFDLSETQKKVHGELYISCDRVRDNAKNNNCSIKEELHRVIFHGVLHLLGFRDKSSIDIKRMRKAEREWLIGYFGSVPRGTFN